MAMRMRKCPYSGKVRGSIKQFPHVSNVLCAHRYYEVELALPSLREVYLTFSERDTLRSLTLRSLTLR